MRNSLLGLAALAVTALLAHVVDCSALGHHEVRTGRSDVRITQVLSGKPDSDGSGDGKDGAKTAQVQNTYLAAELFSGVAAPAQSEQRSPEAIALAAGGRNTSLAHRRTTVLLV